MIILVLRLVLGRSKCKRRYEEEPKQLQSSGDPIRDEVSDSNKDASSGKDPMDDSGEPRLR